MTHIFYPAKIKRSIEQTLRRHEHDLAVIPEQLHALREHMAGAMRELNHAHETLEAMDIHSHYDLTGD